MGLLLVLMAAAFDARSRAVADNPAPPPPPGQGDPVEPWEGHIPSTLYPDGPGAILITELSAEEQEGIHRIGERTNYGPSVRAAWSAAVHSLAADAEVQRAGHQSGTTGLDTIGVEP